MTDKAKDERVESALPPDDAAYRARSDRERTSALPPDRAAYRARSARERTSALPPGKAGQTDVMSPRKEDYHQREAKR